MSAGQGRGKPSLSFYYSFNTDGTVYCVCCGSCPKLVVWIEFLFTWRLPVCQSCAREVFHLDA